MKQLEIDVRRHPGLNIDRNFPSGITFALAFLWYDRCRKWRKCQKMFILHQLFFSYNQCPSSTCYNRNRKSEPFSYEIGSYFWLQFRCWLSSPCNCIG